MSAAARVVLYFYRLKRDDFVREFCTIRPADPHQRVSTLGPDGTWHAWESHWEGDVQVFRPPDSYHGDQVLEWFYDGRLQIGRELPRPQHERAALDNRTSVVLG